ncbi:MAG: hypothetical protein HC837_20735 [Chloroflexaceae bacterium]|nr:hypothetical protein [Chloroflexaceae bacterium]
MPLRDDAIALCWLSLLSLALWALAYQQPLWLTLNIGGDSVTHRREDDAPFLSGFHASEPADRQVAEWWTLPPGYSYRWATPEATIHLPGVGGGRWLITLDASSGRPDGSPSRSTWQPAEQPPLTLLLAAEFRTYTLLLPATAAGDLTIDMQTEAYQSPTDPRDLGFALRSWQLAPTQGDWLRWPAWGQLAWLLVALLLFYGLARGLVLWWRGAVLLSSAAALLLASLLAWTRLPLTLFTPALVVLLALCGLLALGVAALTSCLLSVPRFRSLVALRWPYGALLALVLVAFALRLGGMLHPHAIFSDHRLHANNLLELGLGSVFFTEGLPAEAGGGQAPYPPGSYIVLNPLTLLLGADLESRVLVMQAGTALLDSLVLVLLWAMLRQSAASQRVALLGAALYLLPPLLLASFSIGEYANIGGQALALPVLALLLWRRLWWRWHGLWLAALGIGLLSHLGVALSLLLVLAAFWLLELVRLLRRYTAAGRQALVRFSLALGSTVVLVLLFYYTVPLFVATFAARLHAGAAAEATPTAAAHYSPLGETLWYLLMALVAPESRLLPIVVLAALTGLAWLWQQRRRGTPAVTPATGLPWLLSAWWLGTGLALVATFLLARQGVRWQHFLYPALCLSAAPVLWCLSQRGRAGRIVVISGVLLTLLQGLLFWVLQLDDYLH